MSRTGRPSKPTNLKLLQGTFRKGRAKNEALPELAMPTVPPELSDLAKVEWGRITQDLYTLGLLSRIDRAALAVYCECWADWVDATRLCASGLTPDGKPLDRKVIKTAAGNLVENPYYSIKKRAAELMHKFLTEFGMTPASRTRIDADPVGSTGNTGTDGSRWSGIG